jgi:hypothetical protein
MADAGRRAHAKAYLEAPRARPPSCSGATRSPLAGIQTDARIQHYMILTRSTGLINSGLWVAMAIVESCGFHGTPDAVLHMSVIGTFEPWTDVRSTTAFEGNSDIEATSPNYRL